MHGGSFPNKIIVIRFDVLEIQTMTIYFDIYIYCEKQIQFLNLAKLKISFKVIKTNFLNYNQIRYYYQDIQVFSVRCNQLLNSIHDKHMKVGTSIFFYFASCLRKNFNS